MLKKIMEVEALHDIIMWCITWTMVLTCIGVFELIDYIRKNKR